MKNQNNISVELHILQNFAPANLNRDDSNQPKDAEFGGYRRARISSQCIKRSIRKSEAFSKRVTDVGFRTKTSKDSLMQIFQNTETYNLPLKEAEELTAEILKNITGGYATKKASKKKEGEQELSTKEKTKVLFYTHDSELQRIAKFVMEEKNAGSKKPVEEGYKKFIAAFANKIDTVDIALFGRMLADEPNMKIDAAAQVAHAISTNKLDSEFDFFTAVDDATDNHIEGVEEQGAGMMGDIGFNSSCFYRYSLIDVNKLNKNLGDKTELAIQGVLGFIEGAVEAIPTGKQTSFAAQNRPEFIMAVVRQNSAPLSLANSFATPVKVSNNGNDNLILKSVTALSEYYNRIKDMYGAANEKIYIASIHDIGIEGVSKSSIQQLVENVSKDLEAMLCGQEA